MFLRAHRPLRRLLGLGILGALAAGLVACDGPDDREAKYRERGKLLFERAEYSRASVEFRNALQIKPTSVEAMFYLGRIAEAQGDLANARKNYDRAYQQNQAFLPALIKLGEFALASGDPGTAQQMSERALSSDANSPAARALSAAVLSHRGMAALAEGEALAALKLQAGHPQASMVLASLASQRQDFDKALWYLDEALKLAPKDPMLLLGRLQALGKAGREDGIDGAFEALIDASPKAHQYKVDYTRRLIAKDRIDDAEAMLRGAAARDPGDSTSRMLLVALLAEKRGWNVAEKALIEFMERAPAGDHSFHFRLAELYVANGRRDKAREVLQGVIARAGTGPGGLAARPMLARLAIGDGNVAEAEQLVAETLRPEPNNADALLIRASLYSNRQEYQPAIVDLRNILRNQPNSPAALRLLAEVYRASGEPLLALDTLRALVAAHPGDVAARVAFADQLRATGQREKAVGEYDTALRASPNLLAALSGKALASVELGNLTMAESIGRHMLGIAAGEGPANTVLGLVALQRKDGPAAIESLTKARQMNPKSRETLAQLVRAYDTTGQREAGVRVLQSAIEAEPADGDARVMLADLQFNQGRLADAESSLRQAIAVQPKSPIPYIKLASLQVKSQRVADAAEILKSGAANAPNSVELWLQLAAVQEVLADHEGARRSYDAVLKRDARHLAASNNLAMLIADSWPRDNAALTQARHLAEPFRDSANPALLDTLGWVLVRLGSLADAVQLLEKAAALAPDEPQIRYHLGAAYLAQGDVARARAHLERAVAGAPTYRGVDDARRLLASN